MRKILVVSEIFPPRVGGSGSWLWDIYSRLVSDNVCLFVGSSKGDTEFDKQHNIECHRSDMTSESWSVMEFRGLAYYIRMISKVYRFAKVQKADVIHCARVMPEGVVALVINKLAGIPYYIFIHGEDIELAKESRESRWLVQRVVKAAKVLVCNSINTEQLLVENWDADISGINCLYPGVDTDYYCPPQNLQGLRQELDLEGRTVVLTVSRLEKRKGHDKLLEALPRIIQDQQDLLYVIVGDGDEMEFLVQKASALGLSEHVRFVGRVSQEAMLKYYQSCDLFVLPNRKIGSSIEGFGIVLLEAQACGKPVLAGDSGGTIETMKVGETGVVADCASVDILEKAVLSLLSDKDKLIDMGKSARALMTETYSWNLQIEIAARTLSQSRNS